MISLCINIDDGPEWALAQAEFKRVGLEVERFQAIVEDNRPLAFNKSVYGCMKLAEGQSLLLFEDDAKFEEEWNYWANPLPHLPEGWLTLHLGCNIMGVDTTVWKMPEFYNNKIAKLHNCFQSHATFYSHEAVRLILEKLNPNIIDDNNHIFDDWLRTNILSMGNSYVLNPMVCFQRPRHSEIWNVHADYTGCHKEGNLYLKTLK